MIGDEQLRRRIRTELWALAAHDDFDLQKRQKQMIEENGQRRRFLGDKAQDRPLQRRADNEGDHNQREDAGSAQSGHGNLKNRVSIADL